MIPDGVNASPAPVPPSLKRRPPRIEAILSQICQNLGIVRAELLNSGKHSQTITEARRQACIELRKLALSYPEIARYLNYKDHTTVFYHCKGQPDPERPNEMVFKATGTYSKPMPPDLTAALIASIHQHMKAYGLENIEVKGRPAAHTITQEPPK